MRRNKVIVATLAGTLLASGGATFAQQPQGQPPAPAGQPSAEQPTAPATQPAPTPSPNVAPDAQPAPVTPPPPAPQDRAASDSSSPGGIPPGAPKHVERAWTPEELKEIEEREKDILVYEGASGEHTDRMKELLRREYEKRVTAINTKYKESCLTADADFKRKRTQSQLLLQEFLKKYPDDAAWTPDVLFRLAKLYYYQINEAWNDSSAPPCSALTGETAVATDTRLPPGIDVDFDGTLDGPDYSPATTLWRDIATRFPGYRLIDGTLYLLAYVTGEAPPFGMGRPGEAKPVWLGLVCRNKFDPLTPPPPPPDPKKLPPCPQPDASLLIENPYAGCQPVKADSKLVDEAWVRIGDAHFNARCELPQAIAAYKQVTQNEKSPYFDNALYMLAWGYYRFNQYEDAIAAFDKFVVSSDKKEAEGEGQLDLRKEAVQYLAISFADPRQGEALSNPVKAVERIGAFYKGRVGEKHVRDVYEELGTVIRTNAGTPTGEGPVPEDMYIAYTKAIEVWRFAIDNYPLHPHNPEIHQNIVDLLELMGDKNAEVAERQRITELYKKGGAWYRANEMNRDAMDAAGRLSENSLIKAAVSVHRRAQEERVAWETGKTDDQLLSLQDDPGRKSYMGLYSQAAQLYEQYLVTYPTSKQLYEFTYRLGDTYFYSEQFDKAVLNYQWVRDHTNMGTKYREKSIKRIVEARRLAVDLGLKHTPPTVVDPPLPTAEGLKSNSKPQDIPDPWLKLQAAFDEYMTWVPSDPDASKLALASAMISYKFLQLDDALTRFDVVFNKFCNTPEAVQAKDGLLVIFESRGQNDKFEATNEKFITKKCGTADQVALADAQNKALRYRQAKKLFDEAVEQERSGQSAQTKFLDSGQAFYAYFVEVSDDNPDKDDALFASAVAFSRGGRPKTAIQLYQIFLDKKEFRQSEYYVEAMFLIAKNYQNAFEYERAADTFLQVYKAAGEKNVKSQKSFDLKQARLDSLYNAAYLRETDTVYFDRSKNDLGAIALYKQYAKEETDRKKASDGYFRIAIIYKKLGKPRDMLDSFEAWKRLFAKDPTFSPSTGQNYVMTFYEAARLAKTPKAAAPLWQATIDAYDKVFNDAVAARWTSAEDKAAYDRTVILAREWAGEAQFRLADQFYKEKFEPFKFKWQKLDVKNQAKTEKAIDASYKALYDIHERTIRELLKVGRFQSTWSLAALVRVGDTSFFAADKLLSTGLPKEIEQYDQKYPDLGLGAQFTETVENRARDEFIDPQDTKTYPFGAKQYWILTLESAKKNAISNEWSKLASQRLNTYIASDLYPVMRDDIVDPEVRP